jgi:hypothetical protein
MADVYGGIQYIAFGCKDGKMKAQKQIIIQEQRLQNK